MSFNSIFIAMHRLLAALLLCLGQAAIFQRNDPLLVNDTALIMGAFSADVSVLVCDRLAVCSTPALLLPTSTSAKFSLASGLATYSTFAVTLTSSAVNDTTVLNVPRFDYFLADGAEEAGTAVLGRSLRLFGRNLAWSATSGQCPPLTPGSAATPGSARVFAVPAGTPPSSPGAIFLPVTISSCFRVDATAPSLGLDAGAAYDIWLDNSLTGPGLTAGADGTFAAMLTSVVFVDEPSWPASIFSLGSTPGCGSLPACVATAGAVGGGTIVIPVGSIYFTGGEAITFPPNSSIALQGAGMDSTALVWPVGSSLPLAAQAIITGADASARWRISDMTISVMTGATGGPQPPGPAMPIVSVNASVGVRLSRVRLLEDLTAAPEFAAGNPVRLVNARFVTLSGCDVQIRGTCSAKWPQNTPLSLHNASDVLIVGSNFTSTCQGWVVTSSLRVAIADSSFWSIGDVSQGQSYGIDMGAPYRAEHFYFGNNSDAGNPAATMRWETMTFDGPGGAYNGTSVAAGALPDGHGTLTLAGAVACRLPLAQGCLYPGMVLGVMRGYGTGQWRRVVSVLPDGVTVVLETPLDPAPAFGADGSYVSITGMVGQATFEGNSFYNGTVIQTYGASLDFIFAGNGVREMFTTQWENTTQVAAGLRLFGHRYVYGYEANWASLVEANVLDCISDFRIYADDIDGISFAGGHVVRRNTIAATPLGVNFLRDGVIESNTFAPAMCAWAGRVLPAGTVTINATSTGVVVRNNTGPGAF